MKINAVIASTMFGIILTLTILQVSYAQTGNSTTKTFHSGTDASPIEAVIMINQGR